MKNRTKDEDYKYIEKYWEVLAAIAWQEYTRHGHGALVIGGLEEAPDDAIYFPLGF
jgi:hypothetical protein